MTKYLSILTFLLSVHSYVLATIYDVTTQTDFNNAISASSASLVDNTINVNVPAGVNLLALEMFPGNPPHSLTVQINGMDPSGTTSFNINFPLNLQSNSTTILSPNTSSVNMVVNNILTQNGGLVTANENSTAVITNTGSYTLNGGTLQLGGSASLSSTGGSFSLGGGTLQVIGSDLTLDLNMSLTLNSVSMIDTNGFNATLSGTVSSPSGSTPAFIKIGNGNLTLSNYQLTGNGEQHVSAGNFFVEGNCDLHYLSIGSASGPSVVADFSDTSMVLTIKKTTAGGEAAAFQIGDFSSAAVVNQSAGTVSILGAAMNISNQSGLGTYQLSGGSILVGSDPNFPTDRAFFTLGRNSGHHAPTVGLLNLSGTGVIDVSSASSSNALILGSLVGAIASSSSGHLNQTGGTIRIHDGGQFFLSGFGNGLYDFSGGVLEIGGLSALATGFGGGSGTYQFNFGGGTIAVIESDLSTDVNMTLVPGSSSTIDTQGFNAILSGQLTNAGALIKVNSGTLTLSGANSYFGGTTLSQGTILLANNTGLGTGSLALSDGTTLSLDTSISASNPIVLTGSDTIYVNSGTGTLSGLLSGTGLLIKSGDGILDLSNPNTYSGGTIINGGTLSLISAGSLSSLGAVNLNVSGSTFDLSSMAATSLTIGDFLGALGSDVVLGSNHLTVGTAKNTSFAGTISGINGSFTKTGSGSLLLSGVNTYNGPTTVSEGTLIVNGSITNSALTVAQGAYLKGTGTLGNVIINGTLEPGNSIGTITGGTFHFINGSHLINEINASGGTDLVVGTTSITIDPEVSLDVVLNPGNFINGTTYVFIQSPNITGTFADVAVNFPRFNAKIEYFINQVQLTLNTNDFASILPPNATSNERNVANYLDTLESAGDVIPGTDLAYVFSILSFATPQQLTQALNTFHPAPYNAMLIAQEYTVLRYSSILVNRLSELNTRCVNYSAEKFNIWTTLVGAYSHQLSSHDQVGYWDFAGGVALGIDRIIGNHFCTGLTGGYTNMHVHWSPGKGTVQTGYVGLYGKYFKNIFYLDANLFVGLDHNETKRQIFAQSVTGTINRTASAHYNGYNYNAYLGLGVEIDHLPFDLDLIASLDWVGMHQKTINEKGAKSLDLHVHSKEANLLRSQLGFTISKYFHNWAPELGLFCAYDKRFNGAKFISNFQNYEGSFVTYGLSPSRFLFLPEIKISGLFLQNRLSLSAAYEAEISSKYYDQSVLLNIGYNF
jgi:autotransporter-associated beta strand protein